MRGLAAVTPGLFAVALAAATGGAACSNATSGDANYPPRETGCPVKALAGEPKMAVDDLGTVTVECTSTGGACERLLLDAVCRRGGDVAWGLGDNTLTATHPVAHAAHSRRASRAARERGCPVQVFTDAPTVRTENVGPVEAICSRDDTEAVCLRELEDQACLLGGNVLWQVEGPTPTGDRQRMRGRAAVERTPQ